MLPLRFQDGEILNAAVDSGAPLTVVDLGGTGRRHRGELRLLDASAPEVTRFIFKDLEVFDLSPRLLGLGVGRPVEALLGFTVLRSFAARLSYQQNGSLTLKDEIPDSNEDLASDCDASKLLAPVENRPRCVGVWSTPPVGGGLVEIGGDTLELEGTRLVIPLCLAADPFDPARPEETGPSQTSGVAGTAVLSTGVGLSIMARSLLHRLRASGARVVEQPAVTLHLPYGSEEAAVVLIERVAAVSDETIELGPCAELARRRRLLVAGRGGSLPGDHDRNGASVAMVNRAVLFAVLDDTRPIIQSLRQELSPFVGDVDVLLGGSFLHHFEVDLDYPARRVILQCAGSQAPAACEVLPFCSPAGHPRCPDRPNQ